MTQEERKAWVVLISLALIQVFMFGPSVAPIGVFITPLMKEFGWNHAQVSRIATAVDVMIGLAAPLGGYLLDRLDARWVMTAGALIAGGGFLLAGHAHSLNELVGCYAIIGVGASFSAILPAEVIVANWFPKRTAMAFGIASFGVAMGLSLSPRLVEGVVASHGWRGGMTATAFPMLLVAAPMSLLLMRTRPRRQGLSRAEARLEMEDIPGLEVGAALGTISFWLLMIVRFVSQVGLGAVYFHAIPYLIHIGYPAATAAIIFGINGLLYGPGCIAMGWAADRFGTRQIFFAGMGLAAAGVVSLLSAGSREFGVAALVGFTVLWGVFLGSTVALPALLAQTHGRRRFGTLSGLMGLAAAVGQGIGPVVAGVLIDRTGSYVSAFEMGATLLFASGLVCLFIFPAKGHDAIPVAPAKAKAVAG